ncbi:MAG: LysR family transcriptional regulator [Paracoccaceae bacterium]
MLNSKLPDIRSMEAFVAVVSCGSMTAAAKMLGVSQPAVTRMVRDLEANVGFDLFRRNGPIISPTEKGIEFYQESQRVMANLMQLKDRAQAIRDGRISTVDIVATPTMAAGMVSPILSQLSDILPDLVQIETTSAERVVHALRRRTADLGFSAFPLDHERLTCLARFESHLVAVVQKGSVHDVDEPLPLSVFSGVRLATVGNSFRIRNQINRAFDDQGILPTAEIVTNSSLNAVMAASAGIGIAISDPVTAYGVPVEGVSIRPLSTRIQYDWGLFTAVESNIRDFLGPLTDAFSKVSEAIVKKTMDAG